MNLRITLSLTAALVTLTACGGPVDGIASPAGEKTTTAGSSPFTTPSRSTTLGDIAPCDLLTKDEAEQVMGPLRSEPAPEKLGSMQGCAFSPKVGSFSVGIRANAGLAAIQANGGEIKEIEIGDRRARQLVDITGSCGIFLEVSATSRVDVVMNVGSTTDPCPLALRIAEFVEPKLP